MEAFLFFKFWTRSQEAMMRKKQKIEPTTKNVSLNISAFVAVAVVEKHQLNTDNFQEHHKIVVKCAKSIHLLLTTTKMSRILDPFSTEPIFFCLDT